jgi:NitT/TauT family transport system permease protein
MIGAATLNPGRGRSTGWAVLRPLRGFIAVAILLSIWEIATQLLRIPPYILPPPSRIATTIWTARAPIMVGVGQTLLEAFAGFGLGCGLALATAVGFQRSRTLELTLLPLTAILQSVPIVALTPVIALIIGRNLFTAIVISAIICFFPMMVNAIRGLGSASSESLELLHVMAASPSQVFWLLRLPVALPYLFAGLRIAATACILGAMVAEWLTGDRGLGFFVVDSASRFRIDLVWAGIVTATILAVLAFSLVTLVESRVIRWHDSERE